MITWYYADVRTEAGFLTVWSRSREALEKMMSKIFRVGPERLTIHTSTVPEDLEAEDPRTDEKAVLLQTA